MQLFKTDETFILTNQVRAPSKTGESAWETEAFSKQNQSVLPDIIRKETRIISTITPQHTQPHHIYTWKLQSLKQKSQRNLQNIIC